MKLSQREERAIKALSKGPIMREQLDNIAGCSNGPDLVSGLRDKGLSVPCERVERIDRDGNVSYPGQYSLTADDRRLVSNWLGEVQ